MAPRKSRNRASVAEVTPCPFKISTFFFLTLGRGKLNFCLKSAAGQFSRRNVQRDNRDGNGTDMSTLIANLDLEKLSGHLAADAGDYAKQRTKYLNLAGTRYTIISPEIYRIEIRWHMVFCRHPAKSFDRLFFAMGLQIA